MAINPIVSVVMITYNHENYIEEAIEGVLMQNCDFAIELIIANDKSTDYTHQVIEKTLAKDIPQHINIRYFNHKENKGMMLNFIWALEQAKGRYIALCEGDDYWTDPSKLQKQVNFLSKSPNYSFICSGYKSLNTKTGEEDIVIKKLDKSVDNIIQGFDINIDKFTKQWITKTMTLTFRRELLNTNILRSYNYTRDVHLIYHLLKKNKGYYKKEISGVYRVHVGGVFSLLSDQKKLKLYYSVYRELSKKNKDDEHLKSKFYSYLKKNIERRNYNDFSDLNKTKLFFELLMYSKNIKFLKLNLKLIIKQILSK
jgi:glycosyltransferase involved in cell wall biosynthesis